MYDREITMYRISTPSSVPRRRHRRWWLGGAILILAASVSRGGRKRDTGNETFHVVADRPMLLRVSQMGRNPTTAHSKTPHA
jgi:hypothetical protein